MRKRSLSMVFRLTLVGGLLIASGCRRESTPTIISGSEIPATAIATLALATETLIPQETRLYVNPATQIADAVRNSPPEIAEQLQKIAQYPQATWIGEWAANPRVFVNELVTAAERDNSIAQIVLYNKVQRDLGGYSAGGASSHDEYREWIMQISQGIGDRTALVILEPDALAGVPEMPTREGELRIQSLKEAIQILESQTQATVTIDVGHPGWLSAETAASLIREVEATNFIVNVSNFNTPEMSRTYIDQIRKILGYGTGYIDTSRSGNGPAADGNWCSPEHAGLGPPPDLEQGYLWVKAPGELDGSGSECGKWAGTAGDFSIEYALELLRLSPYIK